MSLRFFTRIKGTTKTASYILIASLFLLGSTSLFSQELSSDPAVLEKGAKVFQGNCTTCHAIHEQVIGPALKDVHERQSVEWIVAFIKNSQKVIASGDEYAVNLYNEYKKTQMTAFGNVLSDEEILAVISYIKDESSKAPVAAATSGDPGDPNVDNGGGEAVPAYLNFILIGLIVVLILILVVLAFIINFITKYVTDNKDLTEEEIEVLEPKFSFGKLVRDNTFLGIIVFIVRGVVLKTAIDGLYTVGVQQGYQPKQPIAFSHEIHAGQNQVDCNYCHTGVRKGKSANIPSANICMNCHTAIKTESKEIAKIYKAIDYDPETGEYGDNTTPIEWVRIHNLPDLAYFNHSQHVKVGNIECQTCHGPIQEMEVVYQYSNLTMGWCINCHRETNVNAKGNAYYDKLVELHGEKSKEPMKVEDIGGLECSKCHY